MSERVHDLSTEALEYYANWQYVLEQIAEVRKERDALAVRLSQVEEARRRVPTAEGDPGKEEVYWLRVKLDAAITHLRDIEDFYRLRGGTPTSYNQVRADRARQLYEAIIEDFREGKMNRPTRLERLGQAEEALRKTEHDNLVLAAWLREARKALQKIEAYGGKVNKAAEHRRIVRAALAASSAGKTPE